MTIYLVNIEDPKILSRSVDIYTNLSKSGGMYMKMFLPQNINYLLDQIDSQMISLRTNLTGQEENANPLYADQTRKKIKEFESAIKELEELK